MDGFFFILNISSLLFSATINKNYISGTAASVVRLVGATRTLPLSFSLQAASYDGMHHGTFDLGTACDPGSTPISKTHPARAFCCDPRATLGPAAVIFAPFLFPRRLRDPDLLPHPCRRGETPTSISPAGLVSVGRPRAAAAVILSPFPGCRSLRPPAPSPAGQSCVPVGTAGRVVLCSRAIGHRLPRAPSDVIS